MNAQKHYKYTMNETMSVAKQAALEVEEFLHSLPETLRVINVENDAAYQKKDIDLLYSFTNKKGKERRLSIEIKGDRHHYTGNYFFETHSNLQRETPGCFMYTEADYLFYYYVKEKELHILPMKETRKWFIEHMEEFVQRGTSTQIGKTERKGYTSAGRLVPRKRVLDDVKGARFISLKA